MLLADSVTRGRAYGSCVNGRRFALTHQTPGTAITGQTSFVATTPTFLLYTDGTAATMKKIILETLSLAQAGAVAGGTIEIVLAIDTANRYSSGGTLIAGQNTNADLDVAGGPAANTPGFLFRFNPTVSAAGAGTRYLYAWSRPASLGDVFSADILSGIKIGKTGSILVYTWAAATGPTWRLAADVQQED